MTITRMHRKLRASRPSRVLLAALAVTVAVPMLGTGNRTDRAADAAEPTVKDGTTLAQAAVSCWAVKRTTPSATSGAYWLLTPQMTVPRRVWCDQETDGGGWELVGRGRNGWTFTEGGQGTADSLADTPAGTGAFTPATLPTSFVTQLMGGLTVNQLAGGVRLRMAANTAGSSWQEVRWNFATATPWRWDFPTGLAVQSATLGTTTVTNRNTRDMTIGTKRIITSVITANGSVQGFNNASSVHGSSAATSYLWEYNRVGYASPFTQVFIRPKLVEGTALAGETSVTFPRIPDAGLPAQQTTTSSAPKQTISSKPVAIGWGVATENDPNDQYSTLNTLVTSIEIIGDTVFVGGKFNNVRNGANAPLIRQPYLAAFNRITGDWISTFRPALDGAVWGLEATPDGKLLIAGNFSSVDGLPSTRALAKLDPATMAIDPTFAMDITRTGGLRPMGRALTIKGDWAYLAGRFNGASGGTPTVANTGIGGLTKFRWATGEPDPNWRPYTDKTVEAISASPTSDHLWMVGYFSTVSGTTAHSSASVSLTTGVRDDPPGMQTVIENSPIQMYQVNREPQWTVGEWNGFVYQGGTQHYFGRHAISNYAQTGWSNQANGDYQTQEFLNGLVYAGCHCGATNTTRQVNGQQVNTGLLSAFGAWDPDTFARSTTFQPDVRNWSEGPWAMETDPLTACLWVGGDFLAGPADVFINGLAKFCVPGGVPDTTPPTTPTSVTAVAEAPGTRLRWSASTDDKTGVITYEVLLNDRLIGTTTATSFFSPFSGPGRYFVRAVDVAGNRSATSAVVSPADTQPVALVAFGSPWKYSADGSLPPAAWDTTGDVAAWPEAAAPLGKGGIGEVSTIPAAGTTQYFVKDVQGTDLPTWGSVRVRLRADDGAIVRVNGVQVARANLGFGVSGPTAVAYQAVTAPGGGATRDITIPASLFVAGTNRISIELHQAVANDTDAYVDAELVVTRNGNDSSAPAAPAAPTASSSTGSAIGVAWAVSPEIDIAGYELQRNGQVIGYFNRNEVAYFDQQLTSGTAYTYAVVAYDQSGNRSAATSAVLSTTGTPPPPPPPVALSLVGPTSSWRFSADGTTPPAGWATTDDLSAWGQGVGPLGAGGLGEATTIPTTAITQYLATDVTVTTPSTYRQIELTIAGDDAYVVRINGTEVARSNIAFGVPTPTTPAYGEKVGPAPAATLRVPADLLVTGTNRISVELHQIRANDTDAYAAVTATALPTNGDTVPPQMSTGSMSSIARTGMQLNWAAATDNAGIGYYAVKRNGVVVTILRRTAVNYLDQQLTPATTYNYEVIAVDTNGNPSTPLALTATTLP